MMPASEIYYDVAMRRLDEQWQRIDALDAKATAIMGAAAALPPIFGVLFAAFDKDPRFGSVLLYGLSFGLYLLMIYWVTLGTSIGKWSVRPDLTTLGGHAKEQNETTVRFWVASECAKSIATNDPKLKLKASYVARSIILLVLIALLLSIAALLDLAS